MGEEVYTSSMGNNSGRRLRHENAVYGIGHAQKEGWCFERSGNDARRGETA